MGTINTTNATRPTRGRVGGTDADRAKTFSNRMPPSAKRSVFIRMKILLQNRNPPVNPRLQEVNDHDAMSAEVRQMVTDMGVDAVGIAAYDPRFAFKQAGGATVGAASGGREGGAQLGRGALRLKRI